jgi:hypothetical protein
VGELGFDELYVVLLQLRRLLEVKGAVALLVVGNLQAVAVGSQGEVLVDGNQGFFRLGA